MPSFLSFLPLVAMLFVWPVVLSGHQDWNETTRQLLWAFLLGISALLIVLTQLFNQGRIGHAGLLVMMSVAIQAILLLPGDAAAYWLFFWFSVLLPVNLLLIHWLPEYRPLSAGAMTWPLLVLVQIILVMVIPQSPVMSGAYGWVLQWQQQPGGGALPVPGWISFTLAAGLLLTRLPRQPHIPLAMLGVLLLQGGAIHSAGNPEPALVAGLLSLLLLFIALLTQNHHLAFTDELTGIHGRRALLTDLRHRTGPYVLVMADIDHFKSFNDTHGHDVGDDVLRLVARQLAQVGGGGKAYRFGGEEFTLVFASNDLKVVTEEVDRLREGIAAYPLLVRDRPKRPSGSRQGKKQRGCRAKDQTLHVTMSFGVALRQRNEDAEGVMKRADKALYKAKQNGRNRVEQAR